jgi:exopolysaccharide biosynthesis protein
MAEFGRQLQAFGAEKAYALDGGQTAVIVTNDTLINRPSYVRQRQISDIIYFATALPDGG